MKDTGQQLVLDRIKELRENTDFVNTLLESLVGYAIIAADFDGNIIAYNEGARQIYDYTPEEVIGKRSIEVFFPEEFIEAGKLQGIIADLIEKGSFSYEGEKVRENGDSFPAQVLFTLTRDKGGKVVGFVEIVEDLTERKRVEETKARVEQLERELRSLERFATPPATAATAKTFGLMPFRQASPESFNQIVQCYSALLDLALEQQAYRVEHDISGNLRAIAEELGSFKAGPRDVVEVHSSALKGKTSDASNARAQAYVEEGRVMVLELMGHMVSYYRTYFRGMTVKKMSEIPVEAGGNNSQGVL